MGFFKGRSKAVEAYATAHEEDGVWVTMREFADDTPPIRVRIRSTNCRRARMVVTAQLRANRQKLQSQGFIPTPDQADANEMELLTKALVADWSGIEDDGVPVPCTPENIEGVLRELGWLRRDIWWAAGQDETFRAAALVAVEGNSQPPSASN